MDYIPFSEKPHPSVPYTCQEPYDSPEGFAEYPAKRGYDKERLLVGDLSSAGDAASITSFCQEWLFFGLMNEIFNFPVDVNDFITTTETGERIVTTEQALPMYLQKWSKNVSARDRRTRMEPIIDQARTFTKCFFDSLAGERTDNDLSVVDPAVALSIAVLGATLEIAVSRRIPRTPAPNQFGLNARDNWGVPRLLVELLQQSGWCINDIHRLAATQSVPSMLYAASIQRREIIPPEVHVNCAAQYCIARTIDESTYMTQHVVDSCDCNHLGPPLDDVKAILDDGGVPAICIGLDENDTVQLVVQPQDKTRCVAISHVWSDGLGNVDGNSLPICQLRRLKECTETLYSKSEQRGGGRALLSRLTSSKSSKPVGIWMDTLSIPRERSYRKLAISRMSQTYAGADKVLMFDSELLKMSAEQSSDNEIMMKIFGSGWMRRVWTMQEGALGSRDFHVQLADGAVFNLSKVAVKSQRSWEGTKLVSDAIDVDATLFHQSFSWLRREYSKNYWRDAVPALASSLQILGGRTTTNAGDAYLCLAGMLNMPAEDIKRMHDTPVEDRTMALISSLRYFPKGIIFSPGPKLAEPGYRWACRSFWQSRPFPDEQVSELFTGGSGLRLENQGFILPRMPGDGTVPEEFVFEYPKAKHYQWYHVSYDSSSEGESLSDRLALTDYTPGQSDLGLIVPTQGVARDGPSAVSSPAALVCLIKRPKKAPHATDESWSALWAQYVGCVTVSRPRGSPDDLASVGQAKRPNTRGSEGIFYQTQIWYVS